MWWSRRAVLAAAIPALASCGFTPTYAPGGSGAALAGAVQVEQLDNINGYTLALALRDRLGPPNPARYRLRYTVSVSSERVAVTTAQSTRRFNLIGRSSFTLEDIATGDVVIRGNVDGFSSYSALGTTVATEAAERDGYDRLMVILAEKIVVRLLAAPELAA